MFISNKNPSQSSLQSPLGPSGTPYPLANNVSCGRFAEKFQVFLPNLSTTDIPRSFDEATSCKEFWDAMCMEITTILDSKHLVDYRFTSK